MTESVLAHFFGGPRDGEVIALPESPLRVMFPAPSGIRPYYTDPLELETVAQTVAYQKRGPTLGGHAYYDHVPE